MDVKSSSSSARMYFARIFVASSISAGMTHAATRPKRKASQARWFVRRGWKRVWVRTAKLGDHCRRAEDGKLVGDLQAAAVETVDRCRPSAAATVAATLAGVLE